MTINKIAERIGVSPSTVKRRLHNVELAYIQDDLTSQHGVVHLDTTYFNERSAMLVLLESGTNRVIYRKFVQTENRQEYQSAIESVCTRGYKIDGLVSDGMRWLFSSYTDVPKQMCQFHMKQIIRRRLTSKPKNKPSQELWRLTMDMERLGEQEFNKRFGDWAAKWSKYLNERSLHQGDKRRYKHRRLRSAVNSLKFFLPYLFTYEKHPDIPSTNNRIEGFFSNLKDILAHHRGMSESSRNRLIDYYIS